MVVNPNMPDEYKNETDYRKIPREYLDANIPVGRGMIKWNAFKSIPEQYERLANYAKNQDKIDKPILSDDQLDELNHILNQKLHDNSLCEMLYYNDGYIDRVVGYIDRINVQEKYIQVSTDDDIGTEIQLDMILEIS
ncbi:YolD-like family protein [Staphylococcus haemolyticus]|uniref:YolD-like family protein n=1 Tax=Staphylococcus haemolyticus TaxID=1283 RepID=UPI001F0A561D|nr:YolD-like family protein [Staphylococcus haemolyticus]MCH4401701.1 YolD-like family protein [Staphylococcus haemolyticus]